MIGISGRKAFPLLLGAALAGCGSSPPQVFHLLGRPADGAGLATGDRGYGVMVGPVTVPDAVDRPQLVVSGEGNRVDIREQQRWAEPLDTGVAQALADDLARALPQAYVYSQRGGPAGAPAPRFRVAVAVQRFESRLRGADAGSLVEADWVLSDTVADRKSICRTRVRSPLAAGGGYDALVAAHQTSLAGLARPVAEVLAQLAAGRTDFTVPEGTACQRQ